VIHILSDICERFVEIAESIYNVSNLPYDLTHQGKAEDHKGSLEKDYEYHLVSQNYRVIPKRSLLGIVYRGLRLFLFIIV
jgi:hypothetical protein